MATGTKVIHFFPATALVRDCSHFEPVRKPVPVSVLDLDNTDFSTWDIYRRPRKQSYGIPYDPLTQSYRPKAEQLQDQNHMRSLSLTRLDHSVDIVSLFTMSIRPVGRLST